MTPATSSAVPANARGITARSVFWTLDEREREQFRRGWWRAYDRKPPDSAQFAYRLGYHESTVAHSWAVAQEIAL
jgi:hypothetical protein